jgi:hypothetical protein
MLYQRYPVFLLLAANLLAGTPPEKLLVIGFVGGRVSHTNAIHQEVQLAAHLREKYPAALDVEIFENHSGPLAHQAILRSLDTNHDGSLSADEKQKARIVLYGHSWGASEAVTTARALQKDGIPVLLTIQVDSVSKRGEDDRLIPANVAEAINLYQLNGFLHGRAKILAADPLRTQILGNFQFEYKARTANCNAYPWFARTFMRPHIEIESDPVVWNRVETLIRSKIKDEKSSAYTSELPTKRTQPPAN